MKYSYLLGKFHYCFHAQLLFLPRLLIIPISCKIKKKKICPISNNAILSSPPFSFPPSSSSFFFFYLIEVGFLDFQETRNRKSNYQKERKENFHYETLFSSR